MITKFGAINTKYKGLSSDAKPTGCRNGDRFLEIDTRVLLMYDEEGQGWNVIVSTTDPVSNLVGFGRIGYMAI